MKWRLGLAAALVIALVASIAGPAAACGCDSKPLSVIVAQADTVFSAADFNDEGVAVHDANHFGCLGQGGANHEQRDCDDRYPTGPPSADEGQSHGVPSAAEPAAILS